MAEERQWGQVEGWGGGGRGEKRGRGKALQSVQIKIFSDACLYNSAGKDVISSSSCCSGGGGMYVCVCVCVCVCMCVVCVLACVLP